MLTERSYNTTDGRSNARSVGAACLKVPRTQSSDGSNDCSGARRDVQQSSRDHRAMNQVYDVAVLVGSLRTGSFTRKTATALSEVAPASLKSVVQIGAFAFFNEDLAACAAELARISRARESTRRAAIRRPGLQSLGSGRPKERARCRLAPVWAEHLARQAGCDRERLARPFPGAFAANHHVRQSMVSLNVPVMPQPEAYIGGAAELFNAEGALTRDSTPEYFTNSCWPSPPAAPATASMLSGSA